MKLGGIHPVTAVMGNASGNIVFYADASGMRLGEENGRPGRDTSAYYLFYAEEIGRPRD